MKKLEEHNRKSRYIQYEALRYLIRNQTTLRDLNKIKGSAPLCPLEKLLLHIDCNITDWDKVFKSDKMKYFKNKYNNGKDVDITLVKFEHEVCLKDLVYKDDDCATWYHCPNTKAFKEQLHILYHPYDTHILEHQWDLEKYYSGNIKKYTFGEVDQRTEDTLKKQDFKPAYIIEVYSMLDYYGDK